MYDKFVSVKYLNNYGIIVILGLVFGLQIVMVGPLSIGISTTPFSIGFRALMVVVSIYLSSRILLFPRVAHFQRGMFWLLVFFGIYSLRFLCDIYVLDVYISPGLGGASRLTQMLFGSIIIPLFGVSVIGIRKDNLEKWIFYASLLQCIAILYIFFILYGATLHAFVSRYYVATLFEDLDIGNPISPIVISRAGGILALCGLFGKNVNRNIRTLSFVLGLILLLLGSSRGPLIAFTLCLNIGLLNYLRKGKFDIILLKLIGLVVLVLVLIYTLMDYAGSVNLGALNRVGELVQSSGEGEERLQTWMAAWNQFIGSPIVGDNIVENHSYSYPHNLFLEILMAVGLVGFIPFLIAKVYAFIKFFKMIRRGKLIVPLLFFYMMISVMVSGGIITSPDYWMAFILILLYRI